MSAGVKGFYGIALVVGVAVAPIPALVAGFFADLARPGAGWAVGLPAFALLAGPLAWRMLGLFRSAAWLEGTTLAVRGPFATRRCDLAAAARFELDVLAESMTGGRTPRLTVYDLATGRRVRLKLIDPATNQWFPPPRLQALAGAILAGRPGRPDGSPAWRAAGALLSAAADPATPLR